MTRRKWTKLRRQRPELFRMPGAVLRWWSWETLSANDLKMVKGLSKAEVVAGFTAYILHRG